MYIISLLIIVNQMYIIIHNVLIYYLYSYINILY